MAYDFLLDPDGHDLVYKSGKLGYTSNIRELLRNKLYISLRTFRGEYFYNTTFGIYNKDLLINKTLTKDQVDAYFIAELNAFPEVAVLQSFVSGYDQVNRIYSFTFVVRTIDDTQGIYSINLIPPGSQVQYPSPQEQIEGVVCELPDIAQTNDYYELLNFDLPTDLSWV